MVLTIFREIVSKHGRTQALTHSLHLLVSTRWLEWSYLVTSSKRHQHHIEGLPVYRQGSQSPRKRRDFLQINWIHESLQIMYNLVISIQNGSYATKERPSFVKILKIFLFLECYNGTNAVFVSTKGDPDGKLPVKMPLMLCCRVA